MNCFVPRPRVPERMMSVQEAADWLNVSEKTVRRAIEAGALQASRIGRQWRISPEDLRHFVEGRSNAPVRHVR